MTPAAGERAGAPGARPPGAGAFHAQRFGRVNWLGLWTLYVREVRRFLKVFAQTVAAPVVTALLFYAIFSVALGNRVGNVGAVPFVVFLAPGLVMMSILQSSFANTSGSLLVSKVQGNIVDVLMPPISPAEMACAYVGGGVTRGMLVGLATAAAMFVFVDLPVERPAAVVFFAVAASAMLSLLGMIGGIWAEKFDHIAGLTNFVVVPLSFLSGTFYSIERLPEAWQFAARFNPFFYAIDGFRCGFIGQGDAGFWLGAAVLAAVDVALFAIVHRLLVTGYKLKS